MDDNVAPEEETDMDLVADNVVLLSFPVNERWTSVNHKAEDLLSPAQVISCSRFFSVCLSVFNFPSLC